MRHNVHLPKTFFLFPFINLQILYFSENKLTETDLQISETSFSVIQLQKWDLCKPQRRLVVLRMVLMYNVIITLLYLLLVFI